jgi:hypothetical protein
MKLSLDHAKGPPTDLTIIPPPIRELDQDLEFSGAGERNPVLANIGLVLGWVEFQLSDFGRSGHGI